MTRQQPTRPTEWKTEKHRFAVRSSLRSNEAPELISLPLASLANYAVFIIAETSKQNVTFGHGSMAGAKATGLAFEERGKEKSSKKDREGSVVRSLQ